MASQGSGSFEEDELQEYPVVDEVQADLQSSSISSVTSKARGRRRIPECWTRVIIVGDGELVGIKVYELASDLLLGSALSGLHSKKRKGEWEPLFSSKGFLREHKDVSLDEFVLDDK